MMKRAITVLGLLLFICFSVTAAEDRVVAKIGETTITAAQFERILKLYDAERSRQMARNPQFKRLVLEKYVDGLSYRRRRKRRVWTHFLT